MKFFGPQYIIKLRETILKAKYVLYKLKTKTNDKGYSFEIIALFISVTVLTSGISIHTTTNASSTLSGAV